MITVKYINTIDGIKDLIFEQTYNEAIDRTRSSYFYRGMRNADYELVTSLRRNCKDAYVELEQPLLENFINYVRYEDPTINESIWKAMVIPRNMVMRLASTFCAHSERESSTPHSRMRFPNIRNPIRDAAEGTKIQVTMEIRMGNRIFVVFDTVFWV